MAAVRRQLDTLQTGPTPAECGAAAQGEIQTAPALHTSKRPLFLWMHRMSAGSSLTWTEPAQDHTLYVWEGRVSAEAGTLAAGDAFIVEHGARAAIRAEQDATLLHFHRPEDSPKQADRGGGGVHHITKSAMVWGADVGRAGYTHYLWADSECPNCTVWLHGHDLPGGRVVAQHYHTEDEVIVVTAGHMKVGSLECGRGTVLAIDAHTHYGFEVCEGGASFINFRMGHPFHVLSDETATVTDERALIRGLLGLRTAFSDAKGIGDH